MKYVQVFHFFLSGLEDFFLVSDLAKPFYTEFQAASNQEN